MAPMMLSSGTSEASSTSPISTPASNPQAEPVAICGLACRLPGGSSSPSEFWKLISRGKSGKCDVPPSRFNIDGFYHPNGMDRPGSIVTKGGYFLDDDIRKFDNSFFGINNLEATYMDPQQRKLLEVVFECLENAGVSLDDASGSNTGCYVGNFTFDYMVMQTKESEYMSRYSATGLGTTILSNRISHVFNLLGPSLVLDTACSSSLYCLHVAATALGNYECDAALVAGANLIQSAEQHIATMKAGVLSPTSECHTFDSSADGYGRGEGIGALYLKRLSDAIRDGDPIRSVIQGSGINANGKTTGISLPSVDGQEAVIRKAMATGGLHPDDITYVECHGTGTKVGDAIEVEALSRVFKRTADRPLLIGSVKSNIGHSEAASGIAGVLKATMALETGFVPPTYGLKNINPKLKVAERHVSIPTNLTRWPGHSSGPRRIGINSFGYGGANAHVILEEAPNTRIAAIREDTKQWIVPQSSVVLPLSAQNRASLDARVQDFSNFDFGDTDILDLAYTLCSRRTQFPARAFLVAPRSNEIARSFASKPLIIGDDPANVSASTPFAFAFTGQGSQWAGMCAEAFSELVVFRNAIKEMDSTLQSIPDAPGWSLESIILDRTDPDRIHLPEISQPACTAIQVALVQLLGCWGVCPRTTLGHSSGEIAAAFAAGYLSAAEAIVIAYYRGFCVAKNRQDGAMMAAGLSEPAAVEILTGLGLREQLTVACVNSPESVTISGDATAIDELCGILQTKGVFARKLKTGGQAYHSRHMLTIGNEYQSMMEKVLPNLGPSVRLPREGRSMISSVTGQVKTSGYGPGYWRENLQSQVRFSSATQQVQERGDHYFVELGPHPSLKLPIKQSLAEVGVTGSRFKHASPIQRNINAMESILSFAGTLWVHGHGIDLAVVNGLHSSSKSSKGLWRVVTDLPRYRFNYENDLWSESRASIEYRQRKYPRHELLGSLLPGGNGRDFIFRNLLKVDDVAWIKDHRLEDVVVFPGAGYLCMAMEALMQATDADRTTSPSFRFSNVNITTALVLSTDPSAQVEMFTSLHKTEITNTATSSTWWDFTISTYQSATAVIHAKGSIAISAINAPLESKVQPPRGLLESTAKRTWYGRFVKSGLNYGPHFQPIDEFQTPRMKSDSLYASAKSALLTACGDPLSVYPIHPVTLDAAIQLCIVATANGVPKDLRAQVPTRIADMTVNTASGLPEAECRIHALSRRSGFASADADAEIVGSNGEIAMQFRGLRLAVYQAREEVQDDSERHPILRVLWKPDAYGLGLMSGVQLEKYAQKFSDEAHSPVKDDGLLKLGATLDLLVHKNPRSTILELNNDSHDFTLAVLEMLSFQHEFKKLAAYFTASFAEDLSISGGAVDLKTGERGNTPTDLKNSKFDFVLIPYMDRWAESQLKSVAELLSEHGVIVGLDADPSTSAIARSEISYTSFPVSNGNAAVFVAHKQQTPRASALKKHNFVIVEREETKLGTALADLLESTVGHSVSRFNLLALRPEHVPSGATVFNLCEAETSMLALITDDEMRGVKVMTDYSGILVWVTGGNTLQGDRPDFALAAGMSRAIALEQPALKFYTYDVDEPSQDVHITAQNLVSTLHQRSGTADREFAQREGVAHVSRFVPDEGLNAEFRAKQGLKVTEKPLEIAGPARLHIDHTGQFDRLYFKQQELPAVAPTEVRIKVASVGLNAKDFYVLSGRVDTPDATCQLECAGTVTEVGSAIADLAVGDRVVAMAPTHFQTYQTLPRWAYHKLVEGETFDACATLPLVYATAIYALHHRASIQPGESVLIHSGAGGVGIAAIQLAKLVGAQIFTTVSTEEKKKFLIDTYGVDPSHIFSSRDTSFLDGILKATSGRGVDVIINSLTGDQLHATWRCSAPFGRFVEIGKLDLSTAGRLEMDQFLKNTTFTSFDLSAIYASGLQDAAAGEPFRKLWQTLLSEVISLFRQGKISAFEPLQVFNVAEAAQAFRLFASRNRMGKVAINLEDAESTISVQPLRHLTRFDSNKSYVMIGCLGGLGRALSRFMVQRGARRFAFLGRSGTDKASARNLVQDLEAQGADCVVVRGDVCNVKDVEAVIGAAQGAIGGVVQAAMGLNEAIFSTMPNKYWHTGIDPKVQGTWNLHNALRASGRDANIDFFLMTSSVSGSVGTATESNYCAANHFLDAFARYLRSRPERPIPGAFALGLGMISEVGYLHDNPDIEALLLRKGIQAIDADELVQIVDLALSSVSPGPETKDGEMGIHHPYDRFAASHLLTGMEASGLKELRKQGFDGTNLAWDDPRAGLLANALDGDDAGAQQQRRGAGGSSLLPAAVARRMEAEPPVGLADALLDHIRARFGNLVLMKFDAVDVRKALADYGMDSMIAAEFKTWFYQEMAVDIPLLTLLHKTNSLETLRDLALADLEKRQIENNDS